MTWRVGLVLHPTRDVSSALTVIAGWAAEHTVELVCSRADADRAAHGVRGVDEVELATGCDALVSLGGDGTTLGALRLVADRPVPVLGVNFGAVGFLNEVEPGELPAALDRLTAGEVSIESHSALEISCGEQSWIAFNDTAVVRVAGSGVVAAELSVDGAGYGMYRCDAVVIATPTGSTAYSYSAGGPVVSPAVAGLVVTPSAPMRGIDRPVVLSEREPVSLRLDAAGGRPALEVDGRLMRYLEPGSELGVRVRPGAGLVARLDARRFSARSRVKLSLANLPLLPEQLRALAPPL